jgi:hypothetical protein
LTDIAGGFRPGAEFHRQSAIGRRVAPCDPPRRGVDALEERILLTEVEPETGKIRPLALKTALHSGDRLGHLRGRRAGFGAGYASQQNSFGRFGASCRNWKRVMPTLFQAMPQKPPAVSNMR